MRDEEQCLGLTQANCLAMGSILTKSGQPVFAAEGYIVSRQGRSVAQANNPNPDSFPLSWSGSPNEKHDYVHCPRPIVDNVLLLPRLASTTASLMPKPPNITYFRYQWARFLYAITKLKTGAS